MSATPDALSGANSTRPRRKSRWPARLDFAQSASGLALGLFMWGHMFFVSSILLGYDAMWVITKMFEGYFLFGQAYPVIVSGVVAVVFTLFVAHAALALRKFPINYAQVRVYRVAHGDDASRGHDAMVVAGGHRLCDVLPRFGASVSDADAPGTDRTVRVGRPRVERALVAAVPGAALRSRAARRHRPVSALRSSGGGSRDRIPTPRARS